MERDEIKERVYRVIFQVLNISAEQIQEEHSFTADLGAKSVQSIEMLAGFEEEFDIDMDEDAALAVQTVGEAIDFIADYVN
jgi:acyl carrier protein